MSLQATKTLFVARFSFKSNSRKMQKGDRDQVKRFDPQVLKRLRNLASYGIASAVIE
jgi:hypothetical protein